jgi:hypothetical protein
MATRKKPVHKSADPSSNLRRELKEIGLSWDRRRPKVVRFTKTGARGTVREFEPIEPRTVQHLAAGGTIAITESSFDFYQPAARGQLKTPGVELKSTSLGASGPLGGTVSLWGPGTPGSNVSLPEPREVLFAGETGQLVCALSNAGGDVIAIKRVGVTVGETSHAGAVTRSHLGPQEVAEYSLPIPVPADACAGFVGALVVVEATLRGEPVRLEKKLTLRFGRLLNIARRVKRISRNELSFDLRIAAELPNGFTEQAQTKGRIRFAVARSGDVLATLHPTGYNVVLAMPGPTGSWGSELPADLLTNFVFLADLPPVNDGKAAFMVATAALMATVRWLGAQAAKALVAAAAQLLGPEVGLPVTLVLYSPPIEAFWGGLMAGTGALSGAEINGLLYDKIFK